MNVAVRLVSAFAVLFLLPLLLQFLRHLHLMTLMTSMLQLWHVPEFSILTAR
jgi:hypothetical protein